MRLKVFVVFFLCYRNVASRPQSADNNSSSIEPAEPSNDDEFIPQRSYNHPTSSEESSEEETTVTTRHSVPVSTTAATSTKDHHGEASAEDHHPAAPSKDHHKAAAAEDYHAAAPAEDHHAAASAEDHAAASAEDNHAAASLEDHHAAASLEDHHATAPAENHHEAAPFIDNHEAASAEDHHAAASLEAHHEAAPFIDHHAAASRENHHATAPAVAHHEAAPFIDHHAAASRENHHPTAHAEGHHEASPFIDHHATAPAEAHHEASPFIDHHAAASPEDNHEVASAEDQPQAASAEDDHEEESVEDEHEESSEEEEEEDSAETRHKAPSKGKGKRIHRPRPSLRNHSIRKHMKSNLKKVKNHKYAKGKTSKKTDKKNSKGKPHAKKSHKNKPHTNKPHANKPAKPVHQGRKSVKSNTPKRPKGESPPVLSSDETAAPQIPPITIEDNFDPSHPLQSLLAEAEASKHEPDSPLFSSDFDGLPYMPPMIPLSDEDSKSHEEESPMFSNVDETPKSVNLESDRGHVFTAHSDDSTHPHSPSVKILSQNFLNPNPEEPPQEGNQVPLASRLKMLGGGGFVLPQPEDIIKDIEFLKSLNIFPGDELNLDPMHPSNQEPQRAPQRIKILKVHMKPLRVEGKGGDDAESQANQMNGQSLFPFPLFSSANENDNLGETQPLTEDNHPEEGNNEFPGANQENLKSLFPFSLFNSVKNQDEMPNMPVTEPHSEETNDKESDEGLPEIQAKFPFFFDSPPVNDNDQAQEKIFIDEIDLEEESSSTISPDEYFEEEESQEAETDPECFTLPDMYHGVKKMVNGIGKMETFTDKMYVVGHSIKKAGMAMGECAKSATLTVGKFLGLESKKAHNESEVAHVEDKDDGPRLVLLRKRSLSEESSEDKYHLESEALGAMGRVARSWYDKAASSVKLMMAAAGVSDADEEQGAQKSISADKRESGVLR